MVKFDNSYSRLPSVFYRQVTPTKSPNPVVIQTNLCLANVLNIDTEWIAGENGIGMMSGNLLPDGANTIATAYAGHQFGYFVPQLGDGRAMLVGEIVANDGNRYDVQLKGSGPTPFSRNGDGFSPLGPVLREYIVSESMHTMGVPTTRALGAVTTGSNVYRESILPGAILTRVAKSHIRVGTCQYFAANGNYDALRILIEHVCERHFPQVLGRNKIVRLFRAVCSRQAELIARWVMLGFVHGVMNTDNMLLCGETVDYGPCAFIDSYQKNAVFSSIDVSGRYAYNRQVDAAEWNLGCFAECLIKLIGEDERIGTIEIFKDTLNQFRKMYQDRCVSLFRKKVGLFTEDSSDIKLMNMWFSILQNTGSDFTLSFRRLTDIAGDDSSNFVVDRYFSFGAEFDEWLRRWRNRCDLEGYPQTERQNMMCTANPIYMLRNHLIEMAINEAYSGGGMGYFNELLDVLRNPFEWQNGKDNFLRPPNQDELVEVTYCGT
ncbi:MAG: hypothetical protein CMQ51_00810 [Gammaproteobacteria bacterium]|nr:hypothetical protein [Gammaproteobacteria bacterium]